MPWMPECHRKAPVAFRTFNSNPEAIAEAEKWKKKGYATRITKSRDFKDRKGNWVYMFVLTVREKKRRI